MNPSPRHIFSFAAKSLPLLGLWLLPILGHSQDLFWVSPDAGTWSEPDNWSSTSGGASCSCVPSATSNIFFDANGLGNSQIAASITVNSLTVGADYTGTITQSSPLTVQNGISLSNGAFTSSSTLQLNNGGFILEAAVAWTAPSTFTFNATNQAITVPNGTGFNAITIRGTQYVNPNLTFNNSITINGNLNLTTSGIGQLSLYILNGSTVTVTEDLIYSGPDRTRIFTGSIDVHGDILLNNTNQFNRQGGDAMVRLVATSGTQNIFGSTQTIATGLGRSPLPNLVIDCTCNVVLSNYILIGGWTNAVSFEYINGTVDPGNSTVAFAQNTVNTSTIDTQGASSTMTFNDLWIEVPHFDPLELSGDLIVLGDLYMANSSGFRLNGNTVYLSGDWINHNLGGGSADGFVEGSAGRVVLNGNTAQQVSSSYVLAPRTGEIFYNLEIDNSSAEGVSLGSNVEITGQLDLVQGKINTLDDTLKIGLTADIIGESASNYITGTLSKRLVNGNSFDFPTGDGTVYAPLSLGAVALSEESEISISYSSSGYPGSQDLGYSGWRSSLEYWEIGASTAPDSYTIELNSLDTERSEIEDCASLFVTQLVTDTWISLGNDACSQSTSEAAIQSNSGSGTGILTFGSNGNNPLPIELASFTASERDGRIQLTWTSLREFNNAFYTVFRSIDGVTFDEIGRVNGSGFSNGAVTYHFTDTEAASGANYYILSQTDWDNTHVELEILKTYCSSCSISASILLKNTVISSGDVIEFIISDAGTTFTIEASSISGVDVSSSLLPTEKQGNSLRIPNYLTAGTYLLGIITDKQVFHFRIIVR